MFLYVNLMCRSMSKENKPLYKVGTYFTVGLYEEKKFDITRVSIKLIGAVLLAMTFFS
jgi:hypothetical protein